MIWTRSVAAANRFLYPRDSSPAWCCSPAGVQGNQTSQTLTVHYTDGTSTPFVQNFSDWFTPKKYLGELEAVAMAYRNFQDGTKDKRTFNLYAYRLVLSSAKVLQSITLPNNPKVVVLAITLVP